MSRPNPTESEVTAVPIPQPRHRWAGLLLAACLPLAATASTVEGHRELLALTGSDLFGWEVDTIADVDGDGIDEVIVPSLQANGSAGRVEVFSGGSGQRLYVFDGAAAASFLGNSVDNAGDVDRDGYDDIAIGAPGEGAGVAYVYSGRHGSRLHRLVAPAGVAGFGGRIAGAGDIDGDGHGDLLVGAAGSPTVTRGAVFLYSGASGALLRRIDAPESGPQFGGGLSPLGDLDGDRRPDLAIGAPTANNGVGKVYVHSSGTGQRLHTLTGTTPTFGRYFVSDAGDFNGDGTGDIYVGDFQASEVRIFSGVDGSLLRWLLGGQGFGTGRGVPDLDNDGFGDLVVGAYLGGLQGTQSGEVTVHLGPDGRIAQKATNVDASQQFGYDSGLAGDVDGDGRQDLLVAATNRNRVEIIAGSVAEGDALVVPGAGHSGSWFDPTHDGEGFAVESLGAGRYAVYWFTYEADGAPRYLVGVGEAVGPRIIVRPLLATAGGRFGGAFAAADVANLAQARLVLSFDGCASGWAEYTVDGVRGRQRLQRLTTIPGLACDSGASAAAGSEYTGSWFRAQSSGEGWVLQAVSADAYLLLWFSYGDDGRQRWFSALGQRDGSAIRFDDLRENRGGRFGRDYDPAEVELLPWGAVTFEFSDCRNAVVRWDGVDGEGSLPLTRLTDLQRVPCAAAE